MNEYFLKMAYKLKEAEDYFNSFNVESAKDFLLNNYKDLDSVYNLLESCGIVDTWSRFEILKDIVIYESYSKLYLKDKLGNLKHICFESFACEYVTIYTKPH